MKRAWFGLAGLLLVLHWMAAAGVPAATAGPVLAGIDCLSDAHADATLPILPATPVEVARDTSGDRPVPSFDGAAVDIVPPAETGRSPEKARLSCRPADLRVSCTEGRTYRSRAPPSRA